MNNKRLSVLYVAEDLHRNSGVTSVIMNFVKHINDSQIQIDLLTYINGDEDILQDIKKSGVKIFYINPLGLSNVFGFIKDISYFFETHKYDIVHSHFCQIDSLVFDAAHKNGVKMCISHSHNTRLSDSRLKAIRNRMLCFGINRKADVWAACSEIAGMCLYGKQFISSSKKLIIKNGVDCNSYKYDEKKRERIRKEFSFTNNDIVLGHVGGFREQKNHSFLIHLMSELVRVDKHYKLLLVGDGDLKKQIESLTIDLGLSNNVVFAGTRNDVSDLLNAFDLFVLPSLYEGLPVVGIEAQANGLKCVFSSSITKEVDLFDNVYIDLNAGYDKWVDEILRIDKMHNIENAYRMAEFGFDINSECERLKTFYLSVFDEYK